MEKEISSLSEADDAADYETRVLKAPGTILSRKISGKKTPASVTINLSRQPRNRHKVLLQGIVNRLLPTNLTFKYNDK